MKATLTIELDFDSWCSEETQPKNKQEWLDFFSKNFVPESSVIGYNDGDFTQLVSIQKFQSLI